MRAGACVARRIDIDDVGKPAAALADQDGLEFVQVPVGHLAIIALLLGKSDGIAKHGFQIFVPGDQVHPQLLVEMDGVLLAQHAIERIGPFLDGGVGESAGVE
jgi:hypothetical protein